MIVLKCPEKPDFAGYISRAPAQIWFDRSRIFVVEKVFENHGKVGLVKKGCDVSLLTADCYIRCFAFCWGLGAQRHLSDLQLCLDDFAEKISVITTHCGKKRVGSECPGAVRFYPFYPDCFTQQLRHAFTAVNFSSPMICLVNA